jgi:hypothetical protein
MPLLGFLLDSSRLRTSCAFALPHGRSSGPPSQHSRWCPLTRAPGRSRCHVRRVGMSTSTIATTRVEQRAHQPTSRRPSRGSRSHRRYATRSCAWRARNSAPRIGSAARRRPAVSIAAGWCAMSWPRCSCRYRAPHFARRLSARRSNASACSRATCSHSARTAWRTSGFTWATGSSCTRAASPVA